MQYQVKRLEKVEREGQEEDEEVFSRAEHEERELRRRLADIEGAIAGLLTDLRFECEPQLLAQSTNFPYCIIRACACFARQLLLCACASARGVASLTSIGIATPCYQASTAEEREREWERKREAEDRPVDHETRRLPASPVQRSSWRLW